MMPVLRPTTPDQPLSAQLGFRMSQADRARLEAFAQTLDLPISDALRLIVRAALKADTRVVFRGEMLDATGVDGSE